MTNVIKLTNGTTIKGEDLSQVEALDSKRQPVKEYWDDSKVAGYAFHLNNGEILQVARRAIVPGYEENVLDAIDTM
jgi:frataxin-like iron-binding protein CyaY